MTEPTLLDHDYHVCARDECAICEGGLGSCNICGGGEITLATHCPGRQITRGEERGLLDQTLDYVDGKWVTKLPHSYVDFEAIPDGWYLLKMTNAEVHIATLKGITKGFAVYHPHHQWLVEINRSDVGGHLIRATGVSAQEALRNAIGAIK